ncbi:hypothetical protein CCZ01_02645 [Helicobacter monodelphidis]|uniref:hypothetical protein n=1 Tax=Helicobacter sp. 15-1451 TaxID=2004995 RepID=UPI000DCC1791|nr:hypothetical protein [Helicobacter sp. 15-1451]RAX58333.1 hypothetical protein CCZ01_02645 [Helicobacter sp. 15-1451]
MWMTQHNSPHFQQEYDTSKEPLGLHKDGIMLGVFKSILSGEIALFNENYFVLENEVMTKNEAITYISSSSHSNPATALLICYNHILARELIKRKYFEKIYLYINSSFALPKNLADSLAVIIQSKSK